MKQQHEAMKRLTEKHISKLAVATGVPEAEVMKLHSLELIDEPRAIDLLIKYDYKRVKARNMYTVKQIVMALKEEYDVPATRVTKAMYSTRRRTNICQCCGREVGKAELRRNNGKCDICRAKMIKL